MKLAEGSGWMHAIMSLILEFQFLPYKSISNIHQMFVAIPSYRVIHSYSL